MTEPKMNCGGAFPAWELEHTQAGVSVKIKPSICEECEFFLACFQRLSAQALGMPELVLSEEDMTDFVMLQRFVASEDASTVGSTLEEVRAMIDARGQTKH